MAARHKLVFTWICIMIMACGALSAMGCSTSSTSEQSNKENLVENRNELSTSGRTSSNVSRKSNVQNSQIETETSQISNNTIELDPETGLLTKEAYDRIKSKMENGQPVSDIEMEEYQKGFAEEGDEEQNHYSDTTMSDSQSATTSAEQAKDTTWGFLRGIMQDELDRSLIDEEHIVNEEGNFVLFIAQGGHISKDNEKELVDLSKPILVDKKSSYATYRVTARYMFKDNYSTMTSDYLVKISEKGIVSLVADNPMRKNTSTKRDSTGTSNYESEDLEEENGGD